jgi:hypothetical protein
MSWRSWLRHCATSWKVAGLITDGIIGIFHRLNPSGHTMALGSAQHGGKRRTVCRADNFPTFVYRFSSNPGSLNVLKPHGLLFLHTHKQQQPFTCNKPCTILIIHLVRHYCCIYTAYISAIQYSFVFNLFKLSGTKVLRLLLSVNVCALLNHSSSGASSRLYCRDVVRSPSHILMLRD